MNLFDSENKGIFRIQERRTGFVIEKREVIKTGFLWWKKETEVWEPVDDNGDTLSRYGIKSVEVYKSLVDANRALASFTEPSKIYNLEEKERPQKDDCMETDKDKKPTVEKREIDPELVPKYKVTDWGEKYAILYKTTNTTGSLWWKKTTEVWKLTDLRGHPVYSFRHINTPPKFYDTLEDAKKALLRIISKPVYYSPVDLGLVSPQFPEDRVTKFG